ncbi:hypothetical protein PoB_002902800 [Plakobranchus ocellatus]|uniref:BLUF domain-containing protein n=1 Tax=Plakobranchus ocellatus TaxID=259542 RepID=A0AAV4A732_9GAST|nr:hypothetical protein PoB_002902800 [Plakobranchus ocellatus]
MSVNPEIHVNEVLPTEQAKIHEGSKDAAHPVGGPGQTSGSLNVGTIKRARPTFRRRRKRGRMFDWPKKNLFEATCLADEARGSMKYLVHRLVYISKIRGVNVDRTAIGNHYDQLVKKLAADYPGSEPITGLMLIYLKHIVHVVETSSDIILKLVHDLQAMEMDEESYVAKSKILQLLVFFNRQHINTRLYQQWQFRTLDIVEHGIEAYDTNESFENLVVEILTQLLKLGVFLYKQPKLNLKNAMDSLHDKVPELLPQQSVVHFLLEENDSSMVTPKEFIDINEKPFDTSLESDMVWPIPTRLFPYN